MACAKPYSGGRGRRAGRLLARTREVGLGATDKDIALLSERFLCPLSNASHLFNIE